jgi:hypothetical protein
MVDIDITANEEGTVFITCTFKDEEGNLVAPITLTYTLSDEEGRILNDKEDEEVVSPESVEIITVTGDDLVILDTDYATEAQRIITIKATYNSDLGNGLSLTGSARFPVEKLIAVE